MATQVATLTTKHRDKAVTHNNTNTYTMRNSSGCYVCLTNFGARIMSIVVPDRDGRMESVVLGFIHPDDYINDSCYHGATIGPVANRISNARFTLEKNTYTLDANDGAHSNHGGFHGLDKHIFRCLSADDQRVVFATETIDGEGGFPGNVQIQVTYTFSNDNMLRIDYYATTTCKTVLNLSNHTYFNLSACHLSALDSILHIRSTQVALSDEKYIPTGDLISTKNSRHDFSSPTPIKHNNHNDYYVLDCCNSGEPAATITDSGSGRVVDLYTSYPGLFFYTADFLSSDAVGIHGKRYAPCDGICLEAQLFPDAVNKPNFPSIEFSPEGEYRHFIAFHFRTER